MREEVKTVDLDRTKQGIALTALIDFRNKRMQDGKCIESTDEVINAIFDAPSKKKKVRSMREAR
jgi:hypothetical protein